MAQLLCKKPTFRYDFCYIKNALRCRICSLKSDVTTCLKNAGVFFKNLVPPLFWQLAVRIWHRWWPPTTRRWSRPWSRKPPGRSCRWPRRSPSCWCTSWPIPRFEKLNINFWKCLDCHFLNFVLALT